MRALIKIHPSKSTRRLTTLVILLAVSLPTFAQEKEKRMTLTGDWKFILGDSKKFIKADYDDSEWEDIYVPSTWEEEGFRHYDGYAWYRKVFKVNFDVNEDLVIELGRIDDSDEVYVNGKFIGGMGGFPPNFFTAYNYERNYVIPAGLLKANAKNVIAIRVYDEVHDGGILGKTPAIYRNKNYSNNSINLFGVWKFRLDDDKSWSGVDVDETDWDDVLVPAPWEQQGFENYDGFAWYRKSFRLPAGYKSNDLMLLIGKIDDMDEVFVNGQLIGSTGDMDRRRITHEDHQQYRAYSIPDNILKPGKANIIAVRVYDETGAGGIYEGPITIIPRAEYKEFWRAYRSSQKDLSYWWSIFVD